MFLVQPCLTGIDEYRLASGDVVEISVIGPPDLAHRAAVDADGRVSLPLLARLNAAGLTLSQLQSSIRELLPTKVFRRRTDDGREYPVLLTADEVTLSVAEYRPVYVNGDVAKPGQQTFRAGLTVRQALVLVVAKPSYSATAQVLIDAKRSDSPGAQFAVVDTAVVESQIETIKTDKIAVAVIKKLALDEDPEFIKPGRFTRLLSMVGLVQLERSSTAQGRLRTAWKNSNVI
jgi:hypothetical protein